MLNSTQFNLVNFNLTQQLGSNMAGSKLRGAKQRLDTFKLIPYPYPYPVHTNYSTCKTFASYELLSLTLRYYPSSLHLQRARPRYVRNSFLLVLYFASAGAARTFEVRQQLVDTQTQVGHVIDLVCDLFEVLVLCQILVPRPLFRNTRALTTIPVGFRHTIA